MREADEIGSKGALVRQARTMERFHLGDRDLEGGGLESSKDLINSDSTGSEPILGEPVRNLRVLDNMDLYPLIVEIDRSLSLKRNTRKFAMLGIEGLVGSIFRL